jgi:hypothetical protein
MAMSTRELERVEVMGRVAKEELKLTDAAAVLRLSYRQVKRLWRGEWAARGCNMETWDGPPIGASRRSFGDAS